MNRVILCSFSGPAAQLPKGQRTTADVLKALKYNPHVSCFDLSEHTWLASACNDLQKAGLVTRDPAADAYPWVRYSLTDAGRARAAELKGNS